jgi:hypothetical protein
MEASGASGGDYLKLSVTESREFRHIDEKTLAAGTTDEVSWRKTPMPYFKCPNCSLRAYSAAGASRCPACDATLLRRHQLLAVLPIASRTVSSPAPKQRTGRWRRRSRDGAART